MIEDRIMTNETHSTGSPRGPFRLRYLATWLAAGVVLLLTFTDFSRCRGATPTYDGGLVIDNGDPEYSEGGPWEDGKNQGDYYRYGMDAGGARKTSTPGSWAKWTPNLPAPGK